jgi:hypothetical protein
MSLVFDEYGRPFIILREQGKTSRKKGEPLTFSRATVGAPWTPEACLAVLT